MKTLPIGTKNWSCPHKQEARFKTIIEPYTILFGKVLPPDRQYWTLCGEMASNGAISEGCELSQMVQVGLIKPNQFHGVEGNPQIHEANVRALKRPFNKAHLYQGELTDILDQALGEGRLAPGIVYIDTIQEPLGAAPLLATTLDILNQTTGTTLVAWNFIKGNRWRGRDYSWNSVRETLNQNHFYRRVSSKWEQLGEDKTFQYEGTGKSSTTMGSVVFFRVG